MSTPPIQSQHQVPAPQPTVPVSGPAPAGVGSAPTKIQGPTLAEKGYIERAVTFIRDLVVRAFSWVYEKVCSFLGKKKPVVPPSTTPEPSPQPAPQTQAAPTLDYRAILARLKNSPTSDDIREAFDRVIDERKKKDIFTRIGNLSYNAAQGAVLWMRGNNIEWVQQQKMAIGRQKVMEDPTLVLSDIRAEILERFVP